MSTQIWKNLIYTQENSLKRLFSHLCFVFLVFNFKITAPLLKRRAQPLSAVPALCATDVNRLFCVILAEPEQLPQQTVQISGAFPNDDFHSFSS